MPEIHISKAPKVKMSRFEFLDQFTTQELSDIESAAETAPTLRVWEKMLSMSDAVDPDHPKLAQGMDLLVSKGVISQTRKDELLQNR